ncbi:hypothetical protein OHB53_46605 [Streptomyces sp. NBC_00056]|uniref:hypothetical protein n=1 Tax=unclassified Streptomyces TaxID=2593676 RepID=UPI00224F51B9|nr:MULTISPECIES: hypothetical protein [unclassified Streptomyces]MCX5443588.1 hypothetical protein [Streptomyces sp. NBC_00063]WUB98978.1 hypothetical protein OHO83_45505 [Streptomyces sp. NBC_00569]
MDQEWQPLDLIGDFGPGKFHMLISPGTDVTMKGYRVRCIWHPRCAPRTPLPEHEPQAHYGCSPSKICHPWLREAVKQWLGTQLEAGVLASTAGRT